MKQFLVILATIGVAYAGVGTLTESEQQDKLSEFNQLCRSGNAPETGVDVGGIRVYCKPSNGRVTKTNTREESVTVPGGEQRVFVQPPVLEQTHNLVIKANLEGTKANVYVVPSDVQNKYNIRTDTKTTAKKPTVFYLGSSGSNSGGF